MEVKLAILKGFQEGKDAIISSVPYELGRSKLASFIIPHMNVSRKHCQIVNENGAWKINDWSSSGTFINNVLVGKGKSSVISNGDSIRLGPVESDLCWTFSLLPEGCSLENNEQKYQKLLNLHNEKQQLYEKNLYGGKVQRLKKNLCEVKTNGPNVDTEIKRESVQEKDDVKIKELQRELQQMQSALNNIEEQNNVLQEKLASEVSNKTAKVLENLMDVMETEMQCTICSELFVIAVTLSCSHTFCKYCIDQWKKKQKTCPICRKKITKETRSVVVDNYIDKVVGNLSLELKERREAVIQERKGVPTKKLKRSH